MILCDPYQEIMTVILISRIKGQTISWTWHELLITTYTKPSVGGPDTDFFDHRGDPRERINSAF